MQDEERISTLSSETINWVENMITTTKNFNYKWASTSKNQFFANFVDEIHER